MCISLTPSIIATLGASSHETAILSIVARRPVLAGLLAAGSPGVFVVRSLEYVSTLKDLHKRNFSKPAFFIRLEPVIIVLEYLLAAASVGNIVELCYRLGGSVLTTTDTGFKFNFFIWFFIGFLIHGFGALALYLRTKVIRTNVIRTKIMRAGLIMAASNLFKSMAQRTSLRVIILEENLLFLYISWSANVLTAFHILYGTVLFSGILFIGVNDAKFVVFRLVASVMICRAILTYELANLHRIVEVIERKPDEKDADAMSDS